MSGPNDPMEWFKLNQATQNKQSNERGQERTRAAIQKLREELEASQTKPVTCPVCNNSWSTKHAYSEENLTCSNCQLKFTWSFEYGRSAKEITAVQIKRSQMIFKRLARKRSELARRRGEKRRYPSGYFGSPHSRVNMATNWYYFRNAQQLGSVSSSKLKDLAATGELQPTDLIWRYGMDEWMPANTIKGLFPESVELHEVSEELTSDEFAELLAQLRANSKQIEDSYEYPLGHLLDHLENNGPSTCGVSKRNDSGEVAEYRLHFSSPEITWKHLCGRSGFYYVDARTYRAVGVELQCMN